MQTNECQRNIIDSNKYNTFNSLNAESKIFENKDFDFTSMNNALSNSKDENYSTNRHLLSQLHKVSFKKNLKNFFF